MQKRAELTSSQIATLVITIAGFLVALVFLLVFLDTEGISERELCRLSVISRATTVQIIGEFVPLNCKTQKVCLSQGSDCAQFAGERGIKKVPIPKANEQAKEALEREVANAMYDCWTMMGEGKLDVFLGGQDAGILNSVLGAGRLFEKETTCMLCSRLALDSELRKNQELLKSIDVTSYLETRQIPNHETTYINAFTNNQVRSYPREFRQNLSDSPEAEGTHQIAVLFMQINTEETPFEAAANTGLNIGGFVFFGLSGLGPFGPLTIKQNALLGAVSGTAAGAVAFYQTWNSRNLAAAYCGEFTSAKEARKGCSIITTFDYNNLNELSKICSIIEGTP